MGLIPQKPRPPFEGVVHKHIRRRVNRDEDDKKDDFQNLHGEKLVGWRNVEAAVSDKLLKALPAESEDGPDDFVPNPHNWRTRIRPNSG